jgi:hypothetical protein
MTLDRSLIEFKAARADAPPSVDVMVSTALDVQKELTVFCPDPRVTWTWIDGLATVAAQPTRSRRLRVSLDGAACGEPGDTTLIFRTPDENFELGLPVQWRNAVDLRVSPTAIYAPNLAPGASYEAHITLVSEDGVSFGIQRVEVDGMPVSTPDVQRVASRSHSLSVLLQIPRQPGVHQSKITVETDQSSFPIANIP